MQWERDLFQQIIFKFKQFFIFLVDLSHFEKDGGESSYADEFYNVAADAEDVDAHYGCGDEVLLR